MTFVGPRIQARSDGLFGNRQRTGYEEGPLWLMYLNPQSCVSIAARIDFLCSHSWSIVCPRAIFLGDLDAAMKAVYSCNVEAGDGGDLKVDVSFHRDAADDLEKACEILRGWL